MGASSTNDWLHIPPSNLVHQPVYTPGSYTPITPVRVVGMGETEEKKKPTATWALAQAIISGVVGYHGWQRTNSLPWTAGWILFSVLTPVCSLGIAVSQGYGKRKK